MVHPLVLETKSVVNVFGSTLSLCALQYAYQDQVYAWVVPGKTASYGTHTKSS